jgi:hypothetical protein
MNPTSVRSDPGRFGRLFEVQPLGDTVGQVDLHRPQSRGARIGKNKKKIAPC